MIEAATWGWRWSILRTISQCSRKNKMAEKKCWRPKGGVVFQIWRRDDMSVKCISDIFSLQNFGSDPSWCICAWGPPRPALMTQKLLLKGCTEKYFDVNNGRPARGKRVCLTRPSLQHIPTIQTFITSHSSILEERTASLLVLFHLLVSSSSRPIFEAQKRLRLNSCLLPTQDW